ncbi:MAG TPA: hypothetical protein VNK24_00590 [Elusimicrobiota bacterium]|nr:hypothetical protein [Elusimicrobiota bacterium]
MKKAFVVSIVIASAAAVAQAGPVPTLSQTFAQLSQALKPAASRLAAAPQDVTFNLVWRNDRWHLLPDPNPPFSGLRIAVYEGRHVRLNLSNPVLAGQDDGASFDVDGLDALADGKPTHGIHVWLPVAVGQITVDFVAPSKESLFPIYAAYSGVSNGPVGQIVVLKP